MFKVNFLSTVANWMLLILSHPSIDVETRMAA